MYHTSTAAYLALMVAYSLVIKRIAILEVMAISAGFVLRAAAGAVAIGVPVSPWLYITTITTPQKETASYTARES